MATDLFGRNDGAGSADVSRLAKGMDKKVNKVVETKSPGTEAAIDKLYNAVNQLATKVDEMAAADLKSAEDFVRQISNFRKKVVREIKSSDGNKDYLKTIAESTKNLWQASQSQHTIWVGVSKFTTVAQRQITEAIKMAGCCGKGQATLKALVARANTRAANSAATRNMAAPPAGGPPSSGGASSGTGGGGSGLVGALMDDAASFGGKMKMSLNIATQLLGVVGLIGKTMNNAFNISPMKVFDGLIQESNEFRMQLRAIVHETQGFGDENRQVEKLYNDITASVLASGVRRGEFQKVWLKNLERGFKIEQKGEKLQSRQIQQAMSVTTSALHTATQLGMNTDAINNLFMDWHMHLSLSASDMADIGRHAQTVARNTGVTGSQLEAALKSSDGIMKSLKAAGMASGNAAKNVMEMMTVFQKYGVGEKGSKIMQALTSKENYFAADNKLKGGLMRAASLSGDPAMMEKIRTGGVPRDKKAMKALGGGYESLGREMMKQFVPDLIKAGVLKSGQSEKDLDMTDLSGMMEKLHTKGMGMTASNINTVMGNVTGMESGELEQFLKANKETLKTSGERIDEITAKMGKMAAAGYKNTDEYNRLQRQLLETQTGGYADAFSQFQKELKANSGDIGKAKASLEQQLTETMGADRAKKFVGDMSGGSAELMKNLEQRASKSGMSLKDVFKEQGVTLGQIQKDLTSGDVEKQAMANESLQKAMQRIERKEKSGQDPITDIKHLLADINTKLGDGFYTILEKTVGGPLGKLMWLVGNVASTLLEILGMVMAFRMLKGLFGGGIKSLFSGAVSSIQGAAETMLHSSASVQGASSGIMTAVRGFGTTIKGYTSIFGKVFSKVFGPLALAIGGLTGYFEAESANRTKSEGVLLGALTGGAGTGSMLSGMLGIEKGGTADKAMGVGGAAIWGGAIGAAIGTAILPGIGTAVGGAIGAVIGGATEIVKIFTEGTNLINRYLIDPIWALGKGLLSPLIGAYEIIAGIFTLDIKRALEGVVTMFLGIPIAIGKALWSVIKGVTKFIINLPELVLQGIKGVFLEFPRWIWGLMKSGLKSLVSNEYIGAIFEPFLEVFNAIGDFFGIIYDVMSPVMDAFIDAAKSIKDAIWAVIGPLFDAGDGFNFMKTLLTSLGEVIKVLSKALGFLIKTALAPVVLLFQTLSKLANGISSLPTMIMDGLKSVFLKLPQFLWEGFKDGLQMVWDWIKSWVPGTKIAEGFTETNEQASVRIEKEGSSLSNAAGRMAGGALDVVTGGEQGGLSGRWEGVKKAAGGAWEGTKAVASAINPFNWFEEGTRQIDQGGVAMLHEGEMVMPKSVWDSIKGIGDGPFGGASGILNSLKDSFMNMIGVPKSSTSMVSEGAFAHGEAKNALDSFVNTDLKKISMYIGDTNGFRTYDPLVQEALRELIGDKSEPISEVVTSLQGLFERETNVDSAMDSSITSIITKIAHTDLNKVISSALSGKTMAEGAKEIFAEVSRALNYESTGSEIATDNEARYFSHDESVTTNSLDYRDDMDGVRGEITSSLLDYTDDIKGEVNTLGLSRAGLESNLERDKYAESSESTAILPSMDAIGDYLINTQSDYLEEMISILEEIKKNTANSVNPLTSIIGKVSEGLMPGSTQSLKGISRDSTRGFWDLAFGDPSPGVVNTEGRGGSM